VQQIKEEELMSKEKELYNKESNESDYNGDNELEK
jgi:hypothetical protein